jgi:hypothetical protein
MLPFAKPIAHERLIEPRAAEVVVSLPHEHADRAFAEPAAPPFDFDHDTAHRLNVLVIERRDLALVGQILIVARKEKHEVYGRANPQSSEQLCPLRPHAAHTNSTGVFKISAAVGCRFGGDDSVGLEDGGAMPQLYESGDRV